MNLGADCVSGGKKTRNTIFKYTCSEWPVCCPCLTSEILSLRCETRLEVGRLHDIPVFLAAVFWLVLMVHLRWGAQGGHWRGLLCHKIRRPGAGTSDPGRNFLSGKGNQRIGCGGAFGESLNCICSHCWARRKAGERGHSWICSSWYQGEKTKMETVSYRDHRVQMNVLKYAGGSAFGKGRFQQTYHLLAPH